MSYSKYRAKKTTCRQRHTHASKREAARCDELTLLERAGEISGLAHQLVFPIIINGKPVKMRNGQVARYTADFIYFEGQRRVVEEVKGYVVRDYPLRRAIIEALYNVNIREV